MAIAWQELQQRYDALSEQLVNPDLDAQKRQELQKEHSYLATLLSKHRTITELNAAIADLEQQAQTADDPEYASMCHEEIASLKADVQAAHNALDDILFPPVP